MPNLETKIFGIGLSKTGTSSLDRALNELGIPSIHYPHDPTTYDELTRGEYRLSVLSTHQGVTDIPVAPFYPQLDQVWPGSKFILTVRETDSWLNSIENHWSFMREWADRDAYFRRFSEFITACVYGAHAFQRERFLYVYRQHESAVRAYFDGREEDLLVFNVCGGEGWDQLCPFLDLPVPDRQFPHANRREEKEERATWIERLDKAVAEFQQIVPADAPYVLIDENQLAGSPLDDPRRVRRIVEQGGQYWGNPRNSRHAIEALESCRRAGALFAVLAWPCAWWVFHYEEFFEYLTSCYRRTCSGANLTVYDLRELSVD